MAAIAAGPNVRPNDVRRSIAPALVQATVVLLCFGSGLLLDHFFLPGPGIVILTMVLGLSLGRSQRHGGTRERLVSLCTLPFVAVACSEVGRLFVHHPTIADVLFTLALGLAIWLRRFGPWATRIGTLISLPFIAVLVTPVPPIHGAAPSAGRSMLWSAVASVIAFLWVWIAQVTATRLGLLPAAHAAGAKAAPRPGTRLQASDRMAVQMALSLGLAFVIGRTLFSTHWTWIVITAFVVNSANRGRGDVAYKSAMRVVGASAGTVAATLLTGLFPPRDNVAVGIILAVLMLGNWLRSISYTYWAACVTSVLSLLQGYFGENDVSLIGERLLQIVLGGALAVVIAWYVLPIQSGHVLRRRLADVLAPLTDALVAAQRAPHQVTKHHHSLDGALAQLEQIRPTFKAHRGLERIRRRGAIPAHPADAIDAAHGIAEPLSVIAAEAEQNPETFAEPAIAGLLKAVTGNVVGARRFIGHRPEARYRRPNVASPDEIDSASAQAVSVQAVWSALVRIDDHVRVICDVYRAEASDAPSEKPDKPEAPRIVPAPQPLPQEAG